MQAKPLIFISNRMNSRKAGKLVLIATETVDVNDLEIIFRNERGGKCASLRG